MAQKLRSLLKKLSFNSVPNTLDVMCQRFFQVFNQHGVETSQIPRLVPQIKLDDLKSPEKLLAVLTPELLDQVATLFNVRVHWLEGIDEEIYDYLGWYKHPLELLEHLKSLLNDAETRHVYPIRVFCTTKYLDFRSEEVQPLAFVLLEKIAAFGDDDIFRYYVYRDGGRWDYSPFRIESKAIARIVFRRLGIPVSLFEISEREMNELLDGRLIPANWFRGCLLSSPSLEDYALSDNESRVAKETEELADVLQYIDEHGLQDFTFVRPSSPEEPPQESVVESTVTSKPVAPIERTPGKRARAQTELWEPARNAALAIWSRDKTMSIADVIRQIQMIPQLKAAKRCESAIRKHIDDLAPEGIAGKPGRKPNKLT